MLQRIGQFLLFTVIVIASVGVSLAQTKQPEFELGLAYWDSGNGGFGQSFAIGYDTGATIGIDKKFGESGYPPPGPGGFNFSFALPTGNSDDYSQIDIRPHPATDSFSITYQAYVSPFKTPATISWNRSKIPAKVTGFLITAAGDSTKLLADMLKDESVTLTGTSQNLLAWWPATIRLYYNATAPNLAAGVASMQGDGSLLSHVEAYPNPTIASGALSFTLAEPASITAVGYDVTGREVLHATMHGLAGHNTIDLSSMSIANGAIVLRLDAVSGTEHETKSIMLMKE